MADDGNGSDDGGLAEREAALTRCASFFFFSFLHERERDDVLDVLRGRER